MRRWLYAFLILCTLPVLGALVLWWSLAWWVPRYLPMLVEKYGVEVEGLRIADDGRWHAESLLYVYEDWRIQVDALAIPSPWVWAWSAYKRADLDKLGAVEIGRVRVEQAEEISALDERKPSTIDWSAAFIWQQVEDAYALSQRWLPPVVLGEWVVRAREPVPLMQGTTWRLEDGVLRGSLSLADLAPGVSAAIEISRQAQASWQVALRAEGDYTEWDQPLENVQADVLLSLGEEGFLLSQFKGQSPWFKADLSQPVRFDFKGPTIYDDARLELSMNLSGQSIYPAAGQFDGWLDLASGVLNTTGAGRLDFGGKLEGLQVPDYEGWTVDGSGSGTWSAGRLDFKTPLLTVRSVDMGELSAAGEGFWQPDNAVAQLSGDLIVRHAIGELRGSITAAYTAAEVSATLDSARFEQRDLPGIELAQPFSLRWPQSAAAAWDWRTLILDPLSITLAETESSVRIDWQPLQKLSLAVDNLPLAILSPWLDLPEAIVELQVERLRLVDFDWSEGLEGRLELAVGLSELEWQEEVFATHADLVAEFSDAGLRIERLEWTAADETLLDGSLLVPLRFYLPLAEAREMLRLVEPAQWQGAFELNLPDRVADWLATATGVQIGESQIAFRVEGEGEDVILHLDASLDHIQLPAREGLDASALVAERVVISLRADRNQLLLEEASVEWGGGRLIADAQLPFAELGLAELIENGMPAAMEQLRSGDWLNALSADVQLEQFHVAFWRALLPPIIRPDGRLEGHLKIRPGMDFSGELIATDFALRPTLTVQAVESIQARLLLDGRRILLEDAGAQLGGNAVSLLGYIDFNERENLQWSLQLKGENLPLVRTVDMLLRADVDLHFEQNEASNFEPMLHGRVNMRSSSLWVQFDPLAPRPAGRTRGPEPPFFALEQDFLQHWKLNIQLTGEQFLRVRNPLFAAEMSATFLLTGNLGEPLLTGVLIMESGVMRMPAMNMRFDRGEVFITPDEPNEIQLELSATGQRANHVISIDAGGTVRNPQLQFSSVPDLTQAQILRILTTGGLDNTGVGGLGLYLGRGLFGPSGTDGGLADRLQFDYGRAVSNSGRNTLDVEWTLSNRASLRGQYDEFDAYNLDLLWRLLKQ